MKILNTTSTSSFLTDVPTTKGYTTHSTNHTEGVSAHNATEFSTQATPSYSIMNNSTSINLNRTIKVVVTSQPLVVIPTDDPLAIEIETITQNPVTTTSDAAERIQAPFTATIATTPVTKQPHAAYSSPSPVIIPKTVSSATRKQTSTSKPNQVVMATTVLASPTANSPSASTTSGTSSVANGPAHFNAQHHMGLTVGLTAGSLTALFLGSMAVTVFLLCRRRKHVDPTLPRSRRARVQNGGAHAAPAVRSIRGVSISSPFAMNAFYTPGYTAYRWQGDGQSQGEGQGGQPQVHLTDLVPPPYNTLSPRLPPRPQHGNLYSTDPTVGGATGGATGSTFPTPPAGTLNSPAIPSHPPPKYETLEHYSHTEYTYQNTQNDGIYESIASRGGNARPPVSGGI